MSNGKHFYTLTFWYDTVEEGTKSYTIHNMDAETYMDVRREVFSMGLALKDPEDPSCGFLIPPWQIRHIKWFKQEKFFQGERPGFNKQMKKTS